MEIIDKQNYLNIDDTLFIKYSNISSIEFISSQTLIINLFDGEKIKINKNAKTFLDKINSKLSLINIGNKLYLNKENITDLEIKNNNKLIISTQNNDKFIIKDKQYFSLFFNENYIPSNPGGQTDQFIKTTYFEVICNDIKEGRSTPQNTGYNFANSGSYFIDFSNIPNEIVILDSSINNEIERKSNVKIIHLEYSRREPSEPYQIKIIFETIEKHIVFNEDYYKAKNIVLYDASSQLRLKFKLFDDLFKELKELLNK